MSLNKHRLPVLAFEGSKQDTSLINCQILKIRMNSERVQNVNGNM